MNKILFLEQNDCLIEDFLDVENTSKPSWWNKLPLFIDGSKNLADFFDKFVKSEGQMSGKTPLSIKTCPGLVDFFNVTKTITWPCDVCLNTTEEGTFTWLTPDGGFLSIDSHHPNQYSVNGEPSFATDMMNIKITFPILFTIDQKKPIEWIYSYPMYEKSTIDYQIMPGLVKLNKNTSMSLVINTLFPLKTANYYFKKGEAFSYMTFLHDSTLPSFKRSDPALTKAKKRSRFFNSYARAMKSK